MPATMRGHAFTRPNRAMNEFDQFIGQSAEDGDPVMEHEFLWGGLPFMGTFDPLMSETRQDEAGYYDDGRLLGTVRKAQFAGGLTPKRLDRIRYHGTEYVIEEMETDETHLIMTLRKRGGQGED